MSTALSLKVKEWPACDQERWAAACQPSVFLSGSSPARNWSPKRRRICEQAYGQWLAHLKSSSCLEVEERSGDRATFDNIKAFVVELQKRVSPWSVAMMVGALQRMLDVMEPKCDWSWIRGITSDLKAIAKERRDKRPHMVSPEQLYDLGIRLMIQARASDNRTYPFPALQWRDGIMIAMLICCPVRIANLVSIEIGTHLFFDHDRYRLRFPERETKTKEAYESELPAELTPWIDDYLKIHRTELLAKAKRPSFTSRLWIDRWGKPMGEASVRTQIEKRTLDAFGRRIWPHLFRTIAATGVVDHAPDQIEIAPDLLGHATLATTSKYYILSRGMQSHRAVQEALLLGRKEALRRTNNSSL